MVPPDDAPAAPSRDDVADAFLDAVPFELYPFQEEAVLAWFETQDGLLVSAPTGMGKTLIAEVAVFEALKTGTRLYYTTPLIALTDQKLAELQDRAEAWGFSRDDVGLLTGNRKLNPDAPVLVVVAEILLNHLLDPGRPFDDVSAVVMDEFHYFNDRERGVVWELSLLLLPAHVRLLLLSATVGNAVDFVIWLDKVHGRQVRLVRTDERKVPLEYHWIEDQLLTEQLVLMMGAGELPAHVPALVFCFSRDECWEMAERLKGLPLVTKEDKARIETFLEGCDLTEGAGPKLRTLLVRGVGVHHAGILPCLKQVVESLFLERLIPYVVCTETLAAGVNLPARSVVLRTLIKGKPGDKKLLPPSDAHQMFGRAGRPQFDTEGHVYALAHEDDVKILRWKEKYDQIPAKTKDAGLLKARKQLERKRPSRRRTEQYWNGDQFETLQKAPPANLASRSMIPTRFLVWLLQHGETLAPARDMLRKRFNVGTKAVHFEKRLDSMVDNLAALGWLERLDDPGPPPREDLASGNAGAGSPGDGKAGAHDDTGSSATNGGDEGQRAGGPHDAGEARGSADASAPLSDLAMALGEALAPGKDGTGDEHAKPGDDDAPPPPRGDRVRLAENIGDLLQWRSIDPLYGAWLAEELNYASPTEKLLALESALDLPYAIDRSCGLPHDLEPGPLQRDRVEPALIAMGLLGAPVPGPSDPQPEPDRERPFHSWDRNDREEPPPTFPQMLSMHFQSQLAVPEPRRVFARWVAGGVDEGGGDARRFVKSRDLTKNEGLVLRHLLRLVLLASEFQAATEDPDYEDIVRRTTEAAASVDARYTERFLSTVNERPDLT